MKVTHAKSITTFPAALHVRSTDKYSSTGVFPSGTSGESAVMPLNDQRASLDCPETLSPIGQKDSPFAFLRDSHYGNNDQKHKNNNHNNNDSNDENDSDDGNSGYKIWEKISPPLLIRLRKVLKTEKKSPPAFSASKSPEKKQKYQGKEKEKEREKERVKENEKEREMERNEEVYTFDSIGNINSSSKSKID